MSKWLFYITLGAVVFAGTSALTWEIYLHSITGDPLQGHSPSYLMNHPELAAKERQWCASRPMAGYQLKNCQLADHLSGKSGG